jgi:hypothetical protein
VNRRLYASGERKQPMETQIRRQETGRRHGEAPMSLRVMLICLLLALSLAAPTATAATRDANIGGLPLGKPSLKETWTIQQVAPGISYTRTCAVSDPGKFSTLWMWPPRPTRELGGWSRHAASALISACTSKTKLVIEADDPPATLPSKERSAKASSRRDRRMFYSTFHTNWACCGR